MQVQILSSRKRCGGTADAKCFSNLHRERLLLISSQLSATRFGDDPYCYILVIKLLLAWGYAIIGTVVSRCAITLEAYKPFKPELQVRILPAPPWGSSSMDRARKNSFHNSHREKLLFSGVYQGSSGLQACLLPDIVLVAGALAVLPVHAEFHAVAVLDDFRPEAALVIHEEEVIQSVIGKRLSIL